MGTTYDLVIVGGGSAGLTAAAFAVQLGARVALVEKDRIGGDCTWSGCVPSKTLLNAARLAEQMRSAHRHGLKRVEPEVDMAAVMSHVRSVVDGVYQLESPEALRSDGIDVFVGTARFLDPHSLAVGEDTITTRKVLLATGARPRIPPIPGLHDVPYLTYETVWGLDALPSRLLVLGAGPIGCEMAQAFQRLGSAVTLVEGKERLLHREEPEASQVLAEVFLSEGMELRLGAEVDRVWKDADGIHLAANGDAVGDAILVAIGRKPVFDGLDLEKAGVTYSATGIQLDEHLRTSQTHIYAAGDCTGGYQFTHYAAWQGFMAVRNALLPGHSKGVSEHVPWTTFTDPEVAHVGLTESHARKESKDTIMTCEWSMERVDRARADGNTKGFVKLVHRKDGTLLGASIVASRAGEMIHEWAVAFDRRLKVGDLASVIHVYPTYSTASMQAAADIRVAQLLSGTSGRVIRGLSRLYR